MKLAARRFSSIWLALAQCIPTTAIAQQEPLVLTADSPWGLDMAENSCALRRMYSNGEHSVLMEMRAFSPTSVMRMMVHSEDLPVRLGRFSYRVLPDSEDREYGNAFSVRMDGGVEGVIFNGSLATAAVAEQLADGLMDEPIALEQQRARESEITGFSLPNSFREPIIIHTGALQAPMDAMRLCLDDLVASWGIDAEAHKTLSRAVQPIDEQQWTRRFAQAYPSSALVRGEQAALHVRLIVDEEGRAEQCSVQSGVGGQIFSDTACHRLMRYARFEPALDAGGAPIKSYWTTSIVYAVTP